MKGKITLVPSDNESYAIGNVPGSIRAGVAYGNGKVPIIFSTNWDHLETCRYIRSLLQHPFTWFDTLDPRPDGELHWVVCHKARSLVIPINEPKPDGSTFYLGRGRAGANWKDRVIYLGKLQNL